MREEDEIENLIVELIYDFGRFEAQLSNRSIIPDEWDKRDDEFKSKFTEIVIEYLPLFIYLVKEVMDMALKRKLSEIIFKD